MTCSTNECGIGGWGGPLPGDPDNNLILGATPAFGGIDVSWSLPTTNPQAVAYVKVYRGVTNDFNSAILIANVGGDRYYDKYTNPQYLTQWYWIQVVSVNGTVGELIGPASALAKPPIATVLEQLAGQIDDGALALSLKTQIDSIGTNFSQFLNEVDARNYADDQLSAELFDLQSSFTQAMTFIDEEIVRRQEGDSALVASLNTAAVAFGDDLAAVQTTIQANIDTVNGEIINIGALYTAKVTVNGLIGGFGIYNDGTEVEAGFDVDTFWIGKTELNKKKPFVISNGEVFINEAVIGTASIDFAKINTATIENLSAITQNVGQISMLRTPSEATYIRFGKASVNDISNAGFWIGVDADGVAGVAIGGTNGLFKYSATEGLQVAGQSVSVVQPGSVVLSKNIPGTFTWTNNTGLYATFNLKMIGGGGGGASIPGGVGAANGTAGGNTVATVKNASGAVVNTYTVLGGAGGVGQVGGSSNPDSPDIVRRTPVLISTEDGAAGGGGYFYYFGGLGNSGKVGAYSSQNIVVPLDGSISVSVGAGGVPTGSTTTYYNRGLPGYAGAAVLTVVGV